MLKSAFIQLLLLGIAIQSALAADPDESESRSKDPVFSICEVLENLPALNGKLISVRGEWIVGEEQNLLRGENCGARLAMSGVAWPSAIWLEPNRLIPDRPDVYRRRRSPAAGSAITGGGRLAPTTKVFATFHGRIETREHFEVVIRGDGKRVGYGFGHLNAFPAVLRYDAVTNVQIIKRPRR